MNESHKYTKRITGLFGRQMPPRKVKKYKGFLPMHFLLTGALPAKKNNWIAANNFRKIMGTALTKPTVKEAIEYLFKNIKSFIRPSKNFLAWEEKTKAIIAEQAGAYAEKYRKYGIIFPLTNVSLSLYCYYAANYVRDNANRLESIQDILVDVGIITTDAWQCLNKIKIEGENYHGEVTENMFHITITINCEKSLKELAEETRLNNENAVDGIAPLFKLPEIPKVKKPPFDMYELMELEWYEEAYDEIEGESAIDYTPHPDKWSKENIEYIIELGYDIEEEKKYYAGLRWDD